LPGNTGKPSISCTEQLWLVISAKPETQEVEMPIYEYKYLECGSLPEMFLRTLNSQGVQCPVCGSDKLERLLSATHALKTSASVPGTTCCGQDGTL